MCVRVYKNLIFNILFLMKQTENGSTLFSFELWKYSGNSKHIPHWVKSSHVKIL